MTQKNLSMEQKQNYRYRKQTVVLPSWRGLGEGWTGRLGLADVLYIGWINTKDLLYSTRNYIQYPMINHNEGWVPNNWCFLIVVLEKTLESPSDSKEIKPVNPKGNQSWIFIGRTDAEAEAPILWPRPKSQSIGKDPDARKDWGQEEKGTAEDEMVGYYWLNEHEFEQTPGDGEGRGRLVCYSPWGHKESNMTQWLNNNNNDKP